MKKHYSLSGIIDFGRVCSLHWDILNPTIPHNTDDRQNMVSSTSQEKISNLINPQLIQEQQLNEFLN